jgi:hypothetical protein
VKGVGVASENTTNVSLSIGADNIAVAPFFDCGGEVSVMIYKHESLTSEQVLDLVEKYYQAWAANQPGGRQG